MAIHIFASPLGPIRFQLDNLALHRLSLGEQLASTQCNENPDSAEIDLAHCIKAWLKAYFAGNQPHQTSIPLMSKGTAFQQKVWESLSHIPYGDVRSYHHIARQIGSHPRAVGGACRANPILLFIPCHRVVRASGRPTGYSRHPRGAEIKSKLLEIEQGNPLARMKHSSQSQTRACLTYPS